MATKIAEKTFMDGKTTTCAVQDTVTQPRYKKSSHSSSSTDLARRAGRPLQRLASATSPTLSVRHSLSRAEYFILNLESWDKVEAEVDSERAFSRKGF